MYIYIYRNKVTPIVNNTVRSAAVRNATSNHYAKVPNSQPVWGPMGPCPHIMLATGL